MNALIRVVRFLSSFFARGRKERLLPAWLTFSPGFSVCGRKERLPPVWRTFSPFVRARKMSTSVQKLFYPLSDRGTASI